MVLFGSGASPGDRTAAVSWAQGQRKRVLTKSAINFT